MISVVVDVCVLADACWSATRNGTENRQLIMKEAVHYEPRAISYARLIANIADKGYWLIDNGKSNRQLYVITDHSQPEDYLLPVNVL